MLEVVRYTDDKRAEWDEFLDGSKNGTFLFKRDYMEYHKDRFKDFSLMLYENNKLKSLFPGNIIRTTFYSHQGLTFGGIISTTETDSIKYIQYFNAYNEFLESVYIETVIYKSIPQIYKNNFGDEDAYVMYRVNADLIGCNLSSCINLGSKIKWSRNRKRNYLKSVKAGVEINNSNRWKDFWEIMIQNLKENHDVMPVHTCEEMISLVRSFPNNIELLTATCMGELVGGAVLYKFNNVLKVQYAHASHLGKEIGAIDNIYQYLTLKFDDSFKYIDFGTSNLNKGLYVNEGLLRQKEGFGARGVVFNEYQYKTKSRVK